MAFDRNNHISPSFWRLKSVKSENSIPKNTNHWSWIGIRHHKNSMEELVGTPGESLLRHFHERYGWKSIHHTTTAQIVPKAQNIDHQIHQLHQTIQQESKYLSASCPVLEQSIATINQAIQSMQQQSQLLISQFEQLELVLLYARTREMESEFSKWRSKGEEELKLFVQQKQLQQQQHHKRRVVDDAKDSLSSSITATTTTTVVEEEQERQDEPKGEDEEEQGEL